MKFIDASEMTYLEYFVRGNVKKGESVWMGDNWTGVDSSHDYGTIDAFGHNARADTVRTDVEFIHLLHERGANQGRHKYDLLTNAADAIGLFKGAYNIYKAKHPNKLISFYDQWDAIRLNTDSLDDFDALSKSSGGSNPNTRAWDFFMPKSYLTKPLREFEASIKYNVQWLRERSRLPIYLCAWHQTKQKNDNNSRYMSRVESDAYLGALQDSGADGVIWWAGKSEGIQTTDTTAPDGTTNTALKLKSWNHKSRYGSIESSWVEAFGNFQWD